MKKNRLISIIIPTYNRAHLISETLDSILSQTYKNWECIIVDDGSMDNTVQILEEYKKKDNRFQFYKRPLNKLKGPNSCRNFGFKKSKGYYIKWFDSDDILLPFAINEQYDLFNDSIDLVISKLQYKNFQNNKILNENNILSKRLIEEYITGDISFYVSGPLWRRSFLENKNLFDENIRNLDDWDFNLRMLYQNPNIIFHEKVVINYRIHENSLSHEVDKLNITEIFSEFEAREKHIKLLKSNKIVNYKILDLFIKKRYKYFFRLAMLQNNRKKNYFFLKTLEKQLLSLDFLGLLKTTIGFVIFSIFKKGYKFLK